MYGSYSHYIGSSSVFLKLLPFLVLLDLVLRGLSLWRSAKKEQKIWFIALLIVNSLGILPIVYLILNRTKKITKSTENTKKTTTEKAETEPSKKKASKSKTK